jgi:GNAT superfamily N-acetyltransferase
MTPRFAAPRDYTSFQKLLLVLDPRSPIPDRARWEADFMQHMLVLDGDEGLDAYVYFDVFRDAAYISQLVVDPSMRGAGVGRGLMTALADHLVGKGIRA